MSVPYILTDHSLTVILDFTPTAVPKTHPNWDRIVEALQSGANDNELRPLLDIPQAVATFMEGSVKIENRVLSLNGRPLESSLTRRILQHMDANEPGLAAPLIKFLENVMENPSYRAVQGLYDWVAKSNLPITTDGYILAWKAVKENYHSIHETPGTVYDHTPGNVVEMPRNACDEDPNQTCSTGLHFCSASYLSNYASGGNRVVVVKIHPRDVTAIPNEYACEKGRCCRYEVVGEVAREKVKDFYPNACVYDGDFGLEEVEEEIVEGPTPLDIKVGQVWRTRDGNEVTITDRKDYTSDYPWWGTVRDTGNIQEFTESGHYYTDQEHPLDLITLVVDIKPGDVDWKAGQVWERRNGDSSVVNRVDLIGIGGAVVYFETGPAVWAESGRSSKFYEGPSDIVRLITDAPELVIKPGDVEFKVGQIWETRDGAERTVARVGITNLPGYTILVDDNSYRTVSGHFWSENAEDKSDLVRLITDVA
jgi:hypothetical protein